MKEKPEKNPLIKGSALSAKLHLPKLQSHKLSIWPTLMP